MVTATDPVLKRRKEEELEEDEEQQKDEHLLLLDQRENEVNSENEDKEALDLILLQSPNWLNLPSDLSRSILNRNSSSIPDLLSFSAVCNPWRSLAKSIPISAPPLLLSSSSNHYPRRSSMNLLKALTPTLDPRTFPSPISKTSLNRNCCGCSFGHLIFASSSKSNVIIADLFSSKEYRLPQPPPGYYSFTHGVLTSPPSSSSCMLFLVCGNRILCWRFGADPGNEDWLVICPCSFSAVDVVAVFNGVLHVLYFNGAVFALEFNPQVELKRLAAAPRSSYSLFAGVAYQRGESREEHN